LIDQHRMEKPQGTRRLNQAGIKAVEFVAERIVEQVDEALEKKWNRRSGKFMEAEPLLQIEVIPQEPVEATCSCGSGIPVRKVMIDGQQVTLIALPLIFEQFRLAGKQSTDGVAGELLETVKVYNPIPSGAEERYAEALLREFVAYCTEKEPAP